MTDDSADEGLRGRLARSSEDALGKLAQDLLENPLVAAALSRAFSAREKAAQAQEVAMGALNLPSAADMERLTRRVRSVSQRLEGIEDGVDRLDEHLADLGGAASLDARLGAIEARLDEVATELQGIAKALPRRASASRSRTRKAAAPKAPKAPSASPEPEPPAEAAPEPEPPVAEAPAVAAPEPETPAAAAPAVAAPEPEPPDAA